MPLSEVLVLSKTTAATVRRMEDRGLVISGVNPELGLVEMIELPDHPFFLAGQFHPEFTSKPTSIFLSEAASAPLPLKKSGSPVLSARPHESAHAVSPTTPHSNFL